MAAPKQVPFRDIGDRREPIQGTEPTADTEGSGRLFFDFDIEVHFVRGHLLGEDFDRFKKIQVVQPLETAFHRLGIDDFLFVEPEFATDHIIAGLVIAPDRDSIDPHHLPFLDTEDDPRGLCLGVRHNRGSHPGKCVPLPSIQVLESGFLFTNRGALEHLPGLNLRLFHEFLFLKHRIAPKPDLANRERLAFDDRIRHGEALAILRQLDDRQTDLHVQIAFVEIHLLDPLHIIAQFLAPEYAGVREQREEKDRLAVGQHFQELLF